MVEVQKTNLCLIDRLKGAQIFEKMNEIFPYLINEIKFTMISSYPFIIIC